MELVSRVVMQEVNFQGFVEAVCDIGIGPDYYLRGEGGEKWLKKVDAPSRNGWIIALHVLAFVIFSVIGLVFLAIREGMRVNLPLHDIREDSLLEEDAR